MRPHTGRGHVRRGTDRGLFGGMDTKRILGTGAAALTALVLIWDEAPIAYSAGEQPRVAYSNHAAPPGPQASPGRETRRRADAVVCGDHTGIGPAARSARPAGADDATADRAGAGTGAENALPPANAKDVVH